MRQLWVRLRTILAAALAALLFSCTSTSPGAPAPQEVVRLSNALGAALVRGAQLTENEDKRERLLQAASAAHALADAARVFEPGATLTERLGAVSALVSRAREEFAEDDDIREALDTAEIFLAALRAYIAPPLEPAGSG